MTNNDSNSGNVQAMNQKLSSAEIGKLWVIYLGNTMSKGILTYYQQHVNDPDIKSILEHAYKLSDEFVKEVTKIYEADNIPVPYGFSKEDTNIGAPRLFADEFYLHYLKYVAKAGLSLYSTAIPLMLRADVRGFLIYCNKETIGLMTKLNIALDKKGFLDKVPNIPYPDKVEFVHKQNYLNGFFGKIRPLHSLEIAHLHDNIENNVTSRALLLAFSQVANKESVRNFMIRGKEITMKHIKECEKQLNEFGLPAPQLLDDLVEASTFAPVSDKIMLFHKIDMFSMKIRTYANAISLNGRRDIGLMYMKFLADVGKYVEDGANIMIKEGWMEKIPMAVDRDTLNY